MGFMKCVIRIRLRINVVCASHPGVRRGRHQQLLHSVLQTRLEARNISCIRRVSIAHMAGFSLLKPIDIESLSRRDSALTSSSPTWSNYHGFSSPCRRIQTTHTSIMSLLCPPPSLPALSSPS
jgi:hypothetical protein